MVRGESRGRMRLGQVRPLGHRAAPAKLDLTRSGASREGLTERCLRGCLLLGQCLQSARERRLGRAAHAETARAGGAWIWRGLGEMPTPDRTEGNEGEESGRSWGRMVAGTKDRQAQASGLCDGVPEVSRRGHLVLPGHGQEGTCHLAELQALTQQIRGSAYTPAAKLPLVPRHNRSSKGVGGGDED